MKNFFLVMFCFFYCGFLMADPVRGALCRLNEKQLFQLTAIVDGADSLKEVCSVLYFSTINNRVAMLRDFSLLTVTRRRMMLKKMTEDGYEKDPFVMQATAVLRDSSEVTIQDYQRLGVFEGWSEGENDIFYRFISVLKFLKNIANLAIGSVVGSKTINAAMVGNEVSVREANYLAAFDLVQNNRTFESEAPIVDILHDRVKETELFFWMLAAIASGVVIENLLVPLAFRFIVWLETQRVERKISNKESMVNKIVSSIEGFSDVNEYRESYIRLLKKEEVGDFLKIVGCHPETRKLFALQVGINNRLKEQDIMTLIRSEISLQNSRIKREPDDKILQWMGVFTSDKVSGENTSLSNTVYHRFIKGKKQFSSEFSVCVFNILLQFSSCACFAYAGAKIAVHVGADASILPDREALLALEESMEGQQNLPDSVDITGTVQSVELSGAADSLFKLWGAANSFIGSLAPGMYSLVVWCNSCGKKITVHFPINYGDRFQYIDDIEAQRAVGKKQKTETVL